jgi:hypothetical protein
MRNWTAWFGRFCGEFRKSLQRMNTKLNRWHPVFPAGIICVCVRRDQLPLTMGVERRDDTARSILLKSIWNLVSASSRRRLKL